MKEDFKFTLFSTIYSLTPSAARLWQKINLFRTMQWKKSLILSWAKMNGLWTIKSSAQNFLIFVFHLRFFLSLLLSLLFPVIKENPVFGLWPSQIFTNFKLENWSKTPWVLKIYLGKFKIIVIKFLNPTINEK